MGVSAVVDVQDADHAPLVIDLVPHAVLAPPELATGRRRAAAAPLRPAVALRGAGRRSAPMRRRPRSAAAVSLSARRAAGDSTRSSRSSGSGHRDGGPEHERSHLLAGGPGACVEAARLRFAAIATSHPASTAARARAASK